MVSLRNCINLRSFIERFIASFIAFIASSFGAITSGSTVAFATSVSGIVMRNTSPPHKLWFSAGIHLCIFVGVSHIIPCFLSFVHMGCLSFFCCKVVVFLRLYFYVVIHKIHCDHLVRMPKYKNLSGGVQK